MKFQSITFVGLVFMFSMTQCSNVDEMSKSGPSSSSSSSSPSWLDALGLKTPFKIDAQIFQLREAASLGHV